LEPNFFITPGGNAIAHISNNFIDNGPITSYDIATVVAAKNSRDLIFKRFNYFFSRRLKHIFHVQIKSLANQIEKENIKLFSKMRSNKFRSRSDLLCCSFLYPYIGFLAGKFIFKNIPTHYYVKIKEKSALSHYESIEKNRHSRKGRLAMCLNDHMITKNENELERYSYHLDLFLKKIYPIKSTFEK